ncbi:uncharacterized protein DUF1441 [Gemmobacter caeni]|uniref:Uncharacterized protein DUF1441 n=1 Tax=Gemmobacter caeni TaxID=589035 RepID=A0A2T6APU0_9RHOB|nr:DUF1441 family protein [Gemmobacter caeni]PTX45835.1 uncharacterized protein DUF1441 [Gemmobacter caeni]TWI94140.1 uncharacterized protein DUF1441 [Gemmobacter caeni]
MSDDDIINLDERRPARGRPPKSEATKSDFMKPCTVSFLASVLRKDKRTIERKLAGVAPVAREGKSDLYDFSQACEAVFRSETGLSAKALASLDPTQLPPITQAAFWNAQRQRIAVYQEAGELWRSDQIEHALDAIVRVFRESLVALPEKLKTASSNGKTHQDVAYAILEAVENQAGRSVRELKGKSFSSELALIEEQMTTLDLFEAGELPEDD